MKKRMRKAANRYKGIQATFCQACSAPVMPHRICSSCGIYKGKQVISVD